MNREIKLRAWYKKHNKIYHYVEHVTYPDGSSGTGCIGYLEGERMFSPDDNEVELLQYTGLKDCAGKEIYEGDILGMENATAKVVFWGRPPEFGLDFSHNEDEWCEDWNLTDDCEAMEIIGNIYEHPELLNRSNEA
jgi:uncharacterized phage protein (TIGR01671 family)